LEPSRDPHFCALSSLQCKIPRIPPLIYEWQINSIEQDTTPYILSNDGLMYIRDESQRSCKAVSGTDKNLIVPDQGPEFVLYCSRARNGTETQAVGEGS
jgi:hypothetical protein